MLKTNNKSLIFNYLFLFFLSIASAFIYLIYRDYSIIFNRLFLAIGFDTVSERQQIQNLFPLPNWVIYSLPGGIWVYVTTIIAKKRHSRKNLMTKTFTALPSVYAIGLEFFQLFHFTDGTFDWVDLTFILLAFQFAHNFNQIEFLSNKHPKFLNVALISAFLVLFLSDVHH